MTRIDIVKGVYFNTIGTSFDGHIWLRPEESLFMLERGALVIYYNKGILSQQHAYTLMMGQHDHQCTLEEYQVNEC